MSDARRLARARAIRAACAVTLGLAGAGIAGGCAESHTPGGDGGPPPPDAPVVADAGCPPIDFSTPPTDQRCCEGAGFWWDPSSARCIVAVPGPFVPPAMA